MTMNKITMPVLIVVGSKDKNTPPEHQQILFESLSGPKDLQLITGAGHNFRSDDFVEQLKTKISSWIKKYVL